MSQALGCASIRRHISVRFIAVLFAVDANLLVESRASPPGWTLRLRSGQARETPIPPPDHRMPTSLIIAAPMPPAINGPMIGMSAYPQSELPLSLIGRIA